MPSRERLRLDPARHRAARLKLRRRPARRSSPCSAQSSGRSRTSSSARSTPSSVRCRRRCYARWPAGTTRPAFRSHNPPHSHAPRFPARQRVGAAIESRTTNRVASSTLSASRLCSSSSRSGKRRPDLGRHAAERAALLPDQLPGLLLGRPGRVELRPQLPEAVADRVLSTSPRPARPTARRASTHQPASARNAFTSAANSLWCWKRKPWAESG